MAEALILMSDWCGHPCNEDFYLMGGDRRRAGVRGWGERGRDKRGGMLLIYGLLDLEWKARHGHLPPGCRGSNGSRARPACGVAVKGRGPQTLASFWI